MHVLLLTVEQHLHVARLGLVVDRDRGVLTSPPLLLGAAAPGLAPARELEPARHPAAGVLTLGCAAARTMFIPGPVVSSGATWPPRRRPGQTNMYRPLHSTKHNHSTATLVLSNPSFKCILIFHNKCFQSGPDLRRVAVR